jgi:hypothetical protein
MTTPSTPELDKAIAALEACIAHFGDENPDDDWAAIQDARAALPGLIALRDGAGWLPIESAPKDGTWILLYVPGHGEARARWSRGHWISHSRARVITQGSHWMPQPPPPASHGEG